ncbi:MAG: peptidase T4 [Alphaproteobacteria bacterium]|nr:peptidase T4 [Alphaproteobacteria bacterium]
MPARPGPANLITDVGGVMVGNAHDSAAFTGVTVIRPGARAVAAGFVAGGGPGTRETDALRADGLVDAVDAIVLSGGSVYGLAAADAVTAALGAAGQGYAMRNLPGVPLSPVVPAAVLYDLANGGDKTWGDKPPYRDLGAQALAACANTFEIGRAGAGFGARAGQDRGGLGSASIVTPDGLIVGALVAVNAFGAVRMPGTEAYWAWPYEQDNEFGGARPPADYRLDLDDWGAAKVNPAAAGRANTTIACVAVNVALSRPEAQRVARMAASGFSRAIRPVFAPFDGDVVFCLSTAAIGRDEPRPILLARLGELGAACLARAIARGVHAAGQGAETP